MTGLTMATERLVAASARGMTRRRLLRRAGGAALTGSLGFALLRPGGVAWADQVACSNVAICTSTRCYGSVTNGSLCHNTSQTLQAGYLHFDCFYSGVGTQCWSESHECVWICCDCCVDYNTGSGQCTDCAGFFFACTCRQQIC